MIVITRKEMKRLKPCPKGYRKLLKVLERAGMLRRKGWRISVDTPAELLVVAAQLNLAVEAAWYLQATTCCDLRRADFSGLTLTGVDLKDSNMRYANLRGANLLNADLRRADLYSADLRGADLRGTDLRGANLRNIKYDHTTLWTGVKMDGGIL